MNHRRPAERASREQLQELLQPWNREFGWAPTAEMKARERRPFWSAESADVQKSIGEIYSGFRMRVGVVTHKAFDPNRVVGGPASLSGPETAIAERFSAWLWEMSSAGQKHYIAAISDVLLHERPCLDHRRFLEAVGLHVEIRKRAHAGKPLLTQRAFAMKRNAEEERVRVVRR